MSLERERANIIDQLQRKSFNFDALALQVFDFQRQYNKVYQEYTELIGTAGKIESIDQIPFLPIQFFKSHQVKTGQDWKAAKEFKSSGTTGQATSCHYVRSLDLYLENSLDIFQEIYGAIDQYKILALLPSYLERDNSSLVAMAKFFMDRSGHLDNGFYLDDYNQIIASLERSKAEGTKSILLGVTFALLGFPEVDPRLFENTIIIETGGMKGRKKEMTRRDLHHELSQKFNVSKIHSEYGMTELLSQAWSTGYGIFTLPRTMHLRLREITDPFYYQPIGKTGIINLIDLANLDSCAFIATDDLARMTSKNQFELLGRVDGSDIRGCNLLYVPK